MGRETRLSDFARIRVRDDGWLSYATRTGTGRGDHFGDAQSVGIPDDEIEQIIAEYLREYPNALADRDDIEVDVR